MKTSPLLVILLIFWTQNAEAKEISALNTEFIHLLQNRFDVIRSTDLSNADVNRMLSINDLWDKIKNSVTNAWNAIKEIANKIKNKIELWVEDLKKRAEEVANMFKAKLEKLQENFNKLVLTIKETAGDVKQCIQEDKEPIKKLLKQITIRVTACVAENLKKGSTVDQYQSRLDLHDSKFVTTADEKIKKCVQSDKDAEECLNKVRVDIYDDMEHAETGIMEARNSVKNIADDALETILQCAADGIIDASAAITEEVLKIINCVMEQKEHSFLLKFGF